MQSRQRNDNRMSMLASPKRLHGTSRGMVPRVDGAVRPSTANNKSSRYWRAGAAGGEPGQQDLINRRQSVGAWLGNNPAPATVTSYDSRMRLLSAASARDAAANRQQTDNTAASMRRRPNSSGVYSLKGNADVPPPTMESPAVQRPGHSQSLPIFHLSGQQQGALLQQQSNQRDDSTNNGLIRGRNGSGLIRRGTTDLAKPTRMGAAAPPRAESCGVGKLHPMHLSSIATNSPSPAFPAMDNGIEIYEPPNRVRPSATEQVSVSPVTISQQTEAAINEKNKFKSIGDNRWPMNTTEPERQAELVQRKDKGVSLPDVHLITPSPLNAPATTATSILAGPSARSGNGVHRKPDDIPSAQSGNGGGVAHRESSFTPVGSLFPKSSSTTYSRATVNDNSAVDSEISPPPPFQKCMTSPLAEKKRMLLTPQQFTTSNANKEWTGPVRPILKKAVNGSMKKIVTFDLSENMYSEHVPYVSPPKAAVESTDSRARALAASMRTPLLNSPGVTADSSASNKDSSSTADELSKGSSLAFRHRNSMLKYKGGTYS